MSAWLLYASAGAAVVAIALHGLFTRPHAARRIIAANLLGSGTFLILVALARRGAEADPVLHALVLTGIVVSVSATACALALARRLGAARRDDGDEPR
ncbi:MAG TPA: NADH-quinone oxidoreductase subunit K [Kofleriaceae bacterium]|nr:NADH-quinone oxidoreductase subunit K [Kofleriaceae bacterium]